MGAERLRRRREDPEVCVAGSLQEAVRSSGLMGGLYQRPDSELLGASPAPMKGGGLPIVSHCHCPLPFPLLSGQGHLHISRPSLRLTREGNMNNKKSPTVTPNLVELLVSDFYKYSDSNFPKEKP